MPQANAVASAATSTLHLAKWILIIELRRSRPRERSSALWTKCHLKRVGNRLRLRKRRKRPKRIELNSRRRMRRRSKRPKMPIRKLKNRSVRLKKRLRKRILITTQRAWLKRIKR